MRSLWVVYAVLLGQHCLAQENLVVNGGFEEVISEDPCEFPCGLEGDLSAVLGWHGVFINIGNGTGANLNSICSSNENCSVPYNVAGFQWPSEGDNYITFWGARCDAWGVFQFWDGVVGTLTSALEKDTFYQLSIDLSLINTSKFGLTKFGVSFSIQPPEYEINQFDLISPDLIINQDLTDTLNWLTLKWLYRSNGNENYFMLSNIPPFTCDSLLLVNPTGECPCAAYHLDNVIVRKATPDEINAVHENKLELSIGPNPTTGPLTIEAKARLQSAWVTDMQGRRLQATHGNGTKWQGDLSSLATGVYFVEAVAEDGRRAVQKIVVMNN